MPQSPPWICRLRYVADDSSAKTCSDRAWPHHQLELASEWAHAAACPAGCYWSVEKTVPINSATRRVLSFLARTGPVCADGVTAFVAKHHECRAGLSECRDLGLVEFALGVGFFATDNGRYALARGAA